MPDERRCAGTNTEATARSDWTADLARRAQTLGRPDPKRARQFMPFAALRGYYDLIREKERVVQPRRDLGQEDRERISREIAQVRKGDMVTARHYDKDAYVDTTGIATRVDPVEGTITIVKRTIRFEDLLWVHGDGIVEEDW